jgi:hypothetical protein
MENEIVKIEYKKFSSFLKDCIKSFSCGYLFLISDEEHSLEETFAFSITVATLDKPLSAEGKVVSVGENESGEKGIGLEFVFDEESRKFIDENLKEIVISKYGSVWGTRLSALF